MLLECERTLKTFFLAGLFQLGKKKGRQVAGVTEEDTKTPLEKDSESFFWGIQTQPWQLFDLNLGLGCCSLAGPKEYLGGLGLDTVIQCITDHEPWFVHTSNNIRITENVGALQSEISSFLFYPRGRSQALNALCRPPEATAPSDWSRLWQGCSGQRAAQRI